MANQVLGLLRAAHVRCNEVCFGASVAASSWHLALHLVKEMATKQLSSSIASNALVARCAARWRTACLLSSQRSVLSCNAACSACEKATAWRDAAALAQRMAPGRLAPDVVSYDALVSSAESWQVAMSYVRGPELMDTS